MDGVPSRSASRRVAAPRHRKGPRIPPGACCIHRRRVYRPARAPDQIPAWPTGVGGVTGANGRAPSRSLVPSGRSLAGSAIGGSDPVEQTRELLDGRSEGVGIGIVHHPRGDLT